MHQRMHMPTLNLGLSARRRARLIASCLTGWMMLFVYGSVFAQLAAPEPNAAEAPTVGGPVRLRQINPVSAADDRLAMTNITSAPVPYVSGEFERFVQRQAGVGLDVRRFGADLISGGLDNRGADLSPLVPAD